MTKPQALPTFLLSMALFACGAGAPAQEAGEISLGDAGPGGSSDVGPPPPKPRVDGGFPSEAGVLPAHRFATAVVSFSPGDCAGFGLPQMPEIVLGPPVGGGLAQGGLDVVSLGRGGSIVLSFEPNAIVDGPGPDFIVFENAFFVAGDISRPFAEPGEVSVSEDGVAWRTFPCTATQPPYGGCAGWRPSLSSPDNGISPLDPEKAGGDPFDLAGVGLARARFVRIVDRGLEACPPNPNKTTTNGFDLDAVAIVNAEKP